MKKQKIRRKIPATAITERTLKEMIVEAGEKAKSVSDWARDNDITPQAVSSFLSGNQTAGLKIPAAFGLVPQTIYVPIRGDRITTEVPSRTKK